MNHFEAAEKMREIAEKLFPGGFNGNPEIDWNNWCAGGCNVEAIFTDGEKTIRLFWDAAFQDMTQTED